MIPTELNQNTTEYLNSIEQGGFTPLGLEAYEAGFNRQYLGLEKMPNFYEPGKYDWNNREKIIIDATTITETDNPLLVDQAETAREAGFIVVGILDKYFSTRYTEDGKKSVGYRKNGPGYTGEFGTDYDNENLTYAGHMFRTMMIVINEFKIYDPEVILTTGLHDTFLKFSEVYGEDTIEFNDAMDDFFNSIIISFKDSENPRFSDNFAHKLTKNLIEFKHLDRGYSNLSTKVDNDSDVQEILSEVISLEEGNDKRIKGFDAETFQRFETLVYEKFVNKMIDGGIAEDGTVTFQFESAKYLNPFQLMRYAAENGSANLVEISTTDASHSHKDFGGLPVYIAMFAQSIDNVRYRNPMYEMAANGIRPEDIGTGDLAATEKAYRALYRDVVDVMCNLLPIALNTNNQQIVQLLDEAMMRTIFPLEMQNIDEYLTEQNKKHNKIAAKLMGFATNSEQEPSGEVMTDMMKINYRKVKSKVEELYERAGSGVKILPTWQLHLRKYLVAIGKLPEDQLVPEGCVFIYGNSKSMASTLRKVNKYNLDKKFKGGKEFDMKDPQDVLEYMAGSNDQLRFTVLMNTQDQKEIFTDYTDDTLPELLGFTFAEDYEEGEEPYGRVNYFDPVKGDAKTESAEFLGDHIVHEIMQSRKKSKRIEVFPVEIHYKSSNAYFEDDFPGSPVKNYKDFGNGEDTWKNMMRIHSLYKLDRMAKHSVLNYLTGDSEETNKAKKALSYMLYKDYMEIYLDMEVIMQNGTIPSR